MATSFPAVDPTALAAFLSGFSSSTFACLVGLSLMARRLPSDSVGAVFSLLSRFVHSLLGAGLDLMCTLGRGLPDGVPCVLGSIFRSPPCVFDIIFGCLR